MAAASQQDKDPAYGGNFFQMIPGKDAADLGAKITTISGAPPGWASPMPTAHEFLQGIRHYGDRPMDEDKLWPVCRAIHSSKVKHLSYFRANLDGRRDPASGEWLFDLLWPDTSPGAPGDQPLSPQALRRLMCPSLCTPLATPANPQEASKLSSNLTYIVQDLCIGAAGSRLMHRCH